MPITPKAQYSKKLGVFEFRSNELQEYWVLGVLGVRSNGHFQHQNIFNVKDGNQQVFSLKNIDPSRSIGLMIVMKESNIPNVQYS